MLNEWLIFIENPENEVVEVLEKKVAEIAEAKQILEILSLDKEARIKYEEREKNLRDRYSALDTAEKRGLQQGLQQGAMQGKLEIILNMVKNQLDDETISKLSGLKIEEIKEMKKQLKV